MKLDAQQLTCLKCDEFFLAWPDRKYETEMDLYLRSYPLLVLPAHVKRYLSNSQKRQRYVNQTHAYLRMFCGSLCSFSFLVMICTSPMHWVQFLVIKNGLELYTGLWTLCNHELCWTHTPEPPYFLQYSRAFFIITVLITLLDLGWFFRSCFPKRSSMTAEFDLKVSIFSFISATCLFFCLNLFMAQVRWNARDVMESDFLWTYHLNWFSDFFYLCAGIISFLNYITFRSIPIEDNIIVIPRETSRLGVGPVKNV